MFFLEQFFKINIYWRYLYIKGDGQKVHLLLFFLLNGHLLEYQYQCHYLLESKWLCFWEDLAANLLLLFFIFKNKNLVFKKGLSTKIMELCFNSL